MVRVGNESWNGLTPLSDDNFVDSGIHATLPGSPSGALARLFSIGDWLLREGSADERLLPAFWEARHVLDRTSAREIFDMLFEDHANVDALMPLISHLEHVGFIIPSDLHSVVATTAATAGFHHLPTTFQSVVVARELGQMLGRESVPTTIFKGSGINARGGRMRLETFMPTNVPDATVREWIREGIGTHIAFVLKRPAFSQVTEIFEAEKCAMPGFMNGSAVTNGGEGITVSYFDRQWRGRRLRIECCHYAKLSMPPPPDFSLDV